MSLLPTKEVCTDGSPMVADRTPVAAGVIDLHQGHPSLAPYHTEAQEKHSLLEKLGNSPVRYR